MNEIDAVREVLEWVEALDIEELLLDDENKTPSHARGYIEDGVFVATPIWTDIPEQFTELHDAVAWLPSSVRYDSTVESGWCPATSRELLLKYLGL